MVVVPSITGITGLTNLRILKSIYVIIAHVRLVVEAHVVLMVWRCKPRVIYKAWPPEKFLALTHCSSWQICFSVDPVRAIYPARRCRDNQMVALTQHMPYSYHVGTITKVILELLLLKMGTVVAYYRPVVFFAWI